MVVSEGRGQDTHLSLALKPSDLSPLYLDTPDLSPLSIDPPPDLSSLDTPDISPMGIDSPDRSFFTPRPPDRFF